MMNVEINAQHIDKILPQTQCTECGFKGCLPYAEAMSKGDAEVNLCRPGGVRVLNALKELLSVNTDLAPAKEKELPAVAVIDLEKCIGCALCIKACPTDAIMGAPKQQHVVIDKDCTGCKLCVDPCPVDCIDIVASSTQMLSDSDEEARAVDIRKLFDARNVRIARREETRLKEKTEAKLKLQVGTNAMESEENNSQKTDWRSKLSPELLERMKKARDNARAKSNR